MEADNRDRTGGLRITSASLYQLSHIGKLYYIIRYKSVCQIKIFRDNFIKVLTIECI